MSLTGRIRLQHRRLLADFAGSQSAGLDLFIASRAGRHADAGSTTELAAWVEWVRAEADVLDPVKHGRPTVLGQTCPHPGISVRKFAGGGTLRLTVDSTKTAALPGDRPEV